MSSGSKVWLVINNDKQKKSWDANGKPLPAWVHNDTKFPMPAPMEAAAVILLNDPAKPPNVALKFDGKIRFGGFYYSGPISFKRGEPFFMAGYNIPSPPKMAQLSLGIAEGPWKTVGSVTVRNGKLDRPVGLSFVKGLEQMQMPKGVRDTVDIPVSLPPSVLAQAFEVTIFGRSGPLFGAGRTQSMTSNNVVDYSVMGHVDDIVRVELKVRPYKWVVFKNVPFPKS